MLSLATGLCLWGLNICGAREGGGKACTISVRGVLYAMFFFHHYFPMT